MIERRVDIVGSYPPPIGGISNHIYRLKSHLVGKVNFHIYNRGFSRGKYVTAFRKNYLWFITYLFYKHDNVVHFHTTLFGFEYLYWFIYSRVNANCIIITIHNDSFLRMKPIIRNVNLLLIKKTNYRELIVVSDKVNRYLAKHKVKNTWLPAYVPVIKSNKTKLNLGDKKHFIFSMYKATQNNINEVYGFDLALDILEEFSGELCMLLLVGDKKNSDIEYLNGVLRRRGVLNLVSIIYGANFINYVNNGVFFLRSNRSDGYGITIQESLELGVVAIASDVCKRPQGAILFKNGNKPDLIEKVNHVLGLNKYQIDNIIKEKQSLDYHETLIYKYENYLSKGK